MSLQTRLAELIQVIGSDIKTIVATLGQKADKSALGSIAGQSADAVDIGGGTIDGVNIGLDTPALAKFTDVEVLFALRSGNANATTDWNTALKTGTYMGVEAANAPWGSAAWFIGNVVQHNDDWVTQEVWSFTSGAEIPKLRRQRVAGVWGPWINQGTWSSTGLFVAGALSATRDQDAITRVTAGNQSTGASAGAAFGLDAYGGSWDFVVPKSDTYVNPLIAKFGGVEKYRYDPATSAFAVSGALTTSEGVVAQGGWSNTNPNPVAEADYAGCSYKWRIVNPAASSTIWEAKLVQPNGSYVDQGDLVFKHHYSGEVVRLKAGGLSLFGNLSLSGLLPFHRFTATGVGVSGLAISTGPGTDTAVFTYNSGTGENRIGGTQAYVFPTFYAGGSERARVDVNGNWIVGATSGSNHKIGKTVAEGGFVLEVGNPGSDTLAVMSVSNGYGYASGADTGVKVGKNAITGRSISAAGTINTSGADGAEYERNNGLSFFKGDIVGFAADGTLTGRYVDAIRFGIKSTNPSWVGGDTWGGEDKVGKRPEPPFYTAPEYVGVPKPVAPIKPSRASEEEVNAEADDAEWEEGPNAYQEQLRAWQTDDDKHQIKVMVAESFHAAALAQYAIDLPIFETKLEAARNNVDRIAYWGKVPCNVLGAHPGGYIIAVEANGGGIAGKFLAKANMSFADYQDAVGRVNRILDDGRCEVAVLVH